MDLVAQIKAMHPGQWLTVSPHVLRELYPPMQMMWPLGPTWSSPERVMEKVIGSAYEYRFWESRETGDVTFERLRAPLKDGRRTYVSPDRRDRFTCTPDGFFVPNASGEPHGPNNYERNA
jgi:hypothetical protein